MTSLMALVEPGEEVLLPDPGWPNYEMMVMSIGAIPVRYRLSEEHDFAPDLSELESQIGPRTKAIVVNSPSNPTGAVFGRAVVRALVDLANVHDLYILSDEVYDELVYEGEHYSPARWDTDGRVISVYSFSKTYAMTGWRVGYTAVPSSIVGALTRIQESMITCVSSVTQAAALAAFTGPQECVAEMCAAYQKRRDLLMGLLDAAGIGFVRPLGAFYLMMSLRGDANSRLAALDLVDKGVAVAPGTAFGEMASSALRISLAASEATISAAAEKLIDWYARTDGGLSVS
jgi:aspartate/methionine/tyrosine aminotransferase